MTVNRLLATAPVLVLDEFLPASEAAECLEECIRLKPFFRVATVGQGSQHRVDSNFRTNLAIGLDSLYAGVEQNSPLISYIGRRVWSDECNALWHGNFSLLDNLNYANYHESQLSRYGNGHRYERHQDTKFNPDTKEELRNRLVTLVYYAQLEPARFTGGELTIYPESDETPPVVKPVHNRAVVFPSFLWHSVAAVTIENDVHENGRFSLNRWMGFR